MKLNVDIVEFDDEDGTGPYSFDQKTLGHDLEEHEVNKKIQDYLIEIIRNHNFITDAVQNNIIEFGESVVYVDDIFGEDYEFIVYSNED